MKISLGLIFLFLLAGCAQPQGETRAKISIASVTGSANYPGGLYFLASKRQSPLEIVKRVPDNDLVDVVLPNGQWDFKIIGWDGGDFYKRFEGEAKCAQAINQSLNGGIIDISVSLSTTSCEQLAQLAVNRSEADSAAQVYDATNKKFVPMSFGSCVNLKAYADAGLGDQIPTQIGCGGDSELMQGPELAFRISLMEKKIDGSFSPGLISECRPLSTYRTYTDINLPMTGFGQPLRYRVDLYSNSSCDLGTKTKSVIFNTGLASGFTALGNQGLAIYDPNPMAANGNAMASPYRFIGLNADSCTGAHLTNEPFAAGSAATANSAGRYLICTKAQFKNIAAAGSCPTETTGLGTMDCEADAIYTLGKDIDFTGSSNITIAGEFSGELRGGFHSLKNGDKPLFNRIKAQGNGGEWIRLNDFNIENFNVPASNVAGANAAGILANEVACNNPGACAADDERVEINNVVIDGQSSITNSTADSYTGGFFGKVEVSGDFYLRESSSYATVTGGSITTPGELTTGTGGFIGAAFGFNNYNKVVIEFAGLGQPYHGALDDTTAPVQITGEENVGGLIGYAEAAEIREGVRAKPELKAKKYVGGLIGKTGKQVSVENAIVDAKFNAGDCTTALYCQSIGGVIGEAQLDVSAPDNLHIHGVNSTLSINTGNELQDVGGILGFVDVLNPSNKFHIAHTAIDMNVVADGQYFGGFIGEIGILSAAPLPNNPSTISSSVVSGNIAKNASGSLSYVGGLFGTNNSSNTAIRGSNIEISRVIIDEFEIIADSDLGMGIGEGEGIKIQESYLGGTIESAALSPYHIGGISGQNIASTLNDFSDLKVGVDITLASSCSTCGILFGGDGSLGSYPIPSVSNIYTVGGANVSINYLSSHTFSAGIEDGASNTEQDSCSNLSGGMFNYQNSTCDLLFKQKWEGSGAVYNSDNNLVRYRAGSVADPFIIDSADDFNKIGTDSLLLSKSFKVTQDIYFSNATPIGGANFVPGGGGPEPFSGTLFGPGKLINATVSGDGLINSCQHCSIGLRNRPLRIENLTVNCGSTNCGTVGVGQDIEMFANVDGGIDGATVAGGVGGLVGNVYDRGEFEGASFSGSVQGSTGNSNAGGLIGEINVVTAGVDATLQLDESFARLKEISGMTTGGLIGYNFANMSNNSGIADTYVWMDLDEQNSGVDISGTTVGGLIGNCSNSYQITVDGPVYLDYTKAEHSGIEQVSGGVGPSGPGSAEPGCITVNGGSLYFLANTDPTQTTSVTYNPASGFDNSKTDQTALTGTGHFNFGWTVNNQGQLVLEWEVFGHDN